VPALVAAATWILYLEGAERRKKKKMKEGRKRRKEENETMV
jgi:hypothetical protein